MPESFICRYNYSSKRTVQGSSIRNGVKYVGKIGPLELILIFGLVLLVFGPSKLPQIGNAIGKGIKEFKKASKEITTQLEVDAETESNKEAK